jgi:hypothetical protein
MTKDEKIARLSAALIQDRAGLIAMVSQLLDRIEELEGRLRDNALAARDVMED